MKNLLRTICLFLVISAGFMACKEKKAPEIPVKSPITRLRESLGDMNYSDQRAIFISLPPEVKFELWKDRLKMLLQIEESKEAQAFLTETLGMISPQMYMDSLRETFYPKFSDKVWLDKGLKAFGNDSTKLKKYLVLLGDENNTPPIITQTQTIQCNCSSASDYCFVYLWDCFSGNCITSNLGCGTFGIYNCDGICKPRNTTNP